MRCMAMAPEHKRLIFGALAGVGVSAVLSLALHRFLGAQALALFFVGSLAVIPTLWARGGRDFWKQLSGFWRATTILLAGAVIFATIALATRHQPRSLLLALIGTVVAASLLLLYLLFSRAMDLLWSRISHRLR